jgi:hypothetical protein
VIKTIKEKEKTQYFFTQFGPTMTTLEREQLSVPLYQ